MLQPQRLRRSFFNISNHPSEGWGEAQREAALALAPGICDLAFPAVPPEADAACVAALSDEVMRQAAEVAPSATYAMVQGEFTLAHMLIRKLQEQGIVPLAATTCRQVIENADRSKTTRFAFVRFREYG
jgi:hypothetical protein